MWIKFRIGFGCTPETHKPKKKKRLLAFCTLSARSLEHLHPTNKDHKDKASTFVQNNIWLSHVIVMRKEPQQQSGAKSGIRQRAASQAKHEEPHQQSEAESSEAMH